MHANREQNRQVLLECYTEMPLILCAKIMQIESRIVQVILERYAEMLLILCKDNANRMLFKINSSIFILLRHSTSSYSVK